jgi:hypothetical protein
VSRVSLDDASHLFCIEQRESLGTLALSTVLPPCAKRGETKLKSIQVSFLAQPGTENGLNVRMRESGARKGLVKVESVGDALFVGPNSLVLLETLVMSQGVVKGIQVRCRPVLELIWFQSPEVRPGTIGALKDRRAVLEFSAPT